MPKDAHAGDAPLRPVDFVKKVGKGKTLSADLTAAEARAAFDLLLAGGFAPAQTGAFLQALRIKELSQDELDALAGAFRARMRALPPLAGARTLVLNLASDTQRKGGLASLLAAHLLPAFGVGVGIVRSEPVLQGNRASFETSSELARGLAAALAGGPGTPGAAGAPVGSPGAGSAPAPAVAACGDLIAGLSALDALRAELGFRSCLHTAEKLVNPWPASPLILGISHKHYALRLAAAMARLGQAGHILLGNHGTVDLVLHKETEFVSVDASGTIREESVAPAAFGLEIPSDVYAVGKFPAWAGWAADIAGADAGARDNGLRRAVQYHLGFLLWAAGAAADTGAGLAAARRGLPKLFA
jgi:anthranilate phosphoribosyltransferase